MFNYLSSYLVGAVDDKQAENETNELNNKREEMRQYDQQPVKRSEEQSQQQAQGGLLNKFYTKMSGQPNCQIILDHLPDRKHFAAGDDLKGKIMIKTSVDGQLIQHEGIKVSLLGMILQVPEYASSSQKNSSGMVVNLNEKRSEITA
jgi:hypothetical protein